MRRKPIKEEARVRLFLGCAVLGIPKGAPLGRFQGDIGDCKGGIRGKFRIPLAPFALPGGQRRRKRKAVEANNGEPPEAERRYGGAQSQAYSDGKNRSGASTDEEDIARWIREEKERQKRAANAKAQREQMMNSPMLNPGNTASTYSNPGGAGAQGQANSAGENQVIADSYVQSDGTRRVITVGEREAAKQRIQDGMNAPVTGVSYGGAQSQANSKGENLNVVLRDQASIDKWKREEYNRKYGNVPYMSGTQWSNWKWDEKKPYENPDIIQLLRELEYLGGVDDIREQQNTKLMQVIKSLLYMNEDNNTFSPDMANIFYNTIGKSGGTPGDDRFTAEDLKKLVEWSRDKYPSMQQTPSGLQSSLENIKDSNDVVKFLMSLINGSYTPPKFLMDMYKEYWPRIIEKIMPSGQSKDRVDTYVRRDR